MVKLPDKAGKKQDGRLKRSQFGNPAGRKAGSRSKVTLAMEDLLEGEAKALTRKVIENARGHARL